MEPFYGPPWDFRPTPIPILWVNYYTNPFIGSEEKIELGQWLNGLPPTYGEWYYQYAERMEIESQGATTQPGTGNGESWYDGIFSQFTTLRTILLIGAVAYFLSQLPKRK